MSGKNLGVRIIAEGEVFLAGGSSLPSAESPRCVCGLTYRQHVEGWPACRGFVPAQPAEPEGGHSV